MKFGVLQFFSWPERRVPLETVYKRAFDRIQIMDEGGYDAVWLAEHHFNSYSICPSVHIMGMHVASMTKNLRIGTAVSLAAFYHPLRLAEEVALLDVLTQGRVNWGAGPRLRPHGVPRLRRGAGGEPGAVLRERRGGAQGLDQRARHAPGQIPPVRGHRSAAEAVAAAAPALLGGRDLAGRDRDGGGTRVHDPDGPARVARRDRRQAASIRRRARAQRLQHRGARDTDGAPSGNRRHGGGGGADRQGRRPLDGGLVRGRPAPARSTRSSATWTA